MNRMGSVVAELANHPDYIRTMKRQFFGWFLRALMVAGKIYFRVFLTLNLPSPHPHFTLTLPSLYSQINFTLTWTYPNLTLTLPSLYPHFTLTSPWIYPYFTLTLPLLKSNITPKSTYFQEPTMPSRIPKLCQINLNSENVRWRRSEPV